MDRQFGDSVMGKDMRAFVSATVPDGTRFGTLNVMVTVSALFVRVSTVMMRLPLANSAVTLSRQCGKSPPSSDN